MENKTVRLIVTKIGSVLVDRRFWAAVFLVVMSLGGWLIPDSLAVRVGQYLGEDGSGGVVLVEGLINALTPIITLLWLIGSWGQRPPSGLEYQQMQRVASYIMSRYGEKVD